MAKNPGNRGPGGSSRGKVEKPKNARKTYLRLLSYLYPYKGRVVLSFVLMILASVGEVAMGYFIKPILNDYVIPGDFNGLGVMIGLMLAIGLGSAFATFLYRRIMIHSSQKVTYTIRQDMFSHMQELPIAFFDENPHGDLMSRFTNDVDNLNDALASSLLALVSSAITFVGNMVVMFLLSPRLFVLTFITIIVMGLAAKAIGERARKGYRDQQKYLGEINSYIEEMVSWTKVLKVFRYEERAIERFEEKSERLREAQTVAQKESGSMMPTLGNISHISYSFIAIFGGLSTINGNFDIGTLVAYLQYSRQLAGPIARATENINAVFSALAGAERIFKLIDVEEEIDQGTYELVVLRENDQTGDLEICDECNTGHWGWYNPETEDLKVLRGEIEFKDVNFSYEEGKPVLKGISFYAKPGQKLGFVGSTGAGKTTIMNLITRFYEPDSGSITYDGIDIRDIRKQDLRKSFGMVLQNVNLFTGTIDYNIRYSNLKASQEEVHQAAEHSNASRFICHLENGYDTVIAGSASELSEGERQLLSISRAALSDPPVLILDEATSSVDTMTELIIQDAMFNLMEGRTVLVIAHRLSTIHDSDAIFVMEDGQIIERGDHDQLMEERGRYYELYTGKKKLA